MDARAHGDEAGSEGKRGKPRAQKPRKKNEWPEEK